MGGQGSGNFDHAGRPGLVGGSGAGSAGMRGAREASRRREEHERRRQEAVQRREEAEQRVLGRDAVGQTLKKIAEEIRHQDNETLIIVDAESGKELGRAQGDSISVEQLPKGLRSQIKGNVEIHNHPEGDKHTDQPPSWPDLREMFRNGSKTMFVVSPHSSYRVDLPDRPLSKADHAKIRDLFLKILAPNPGDMPRDPTNADWRRLAERTGMKYKSSLD